MNLLLYSLLFWNLLVFLVYGIDKRRAIRHSWRISEKVLLVIAFFFGGLGAFTGGVVFHHKTRKWYFQVVWHLGIMATLLLIYFANKHF